MGVSGLIVFWAAAISAASLPSCSTSGRAFLASMVGQWSVTASNRVAEGEFEEVEGRSDVTLGLDGCALIERYETAGVQPASSRIIVLSAKEDGTFELARLDSEHGGFTVSTGDFEGGTLTLEWSRNLGDRTLRTRSVYHVLDESRLQLEQFLSRREGAEWELTYRGEYERVG